MDFNWLEGPPEATQERVLSISISRDLAWSVPTPEADFEDIVRAIAPLRGSQYIGAFRNAINIGANENYFDIQVGSSFVQQWRDYKLGSSRKHIAEAISVTESIRNIFGYESLRDQSNSS